MKLVTFEHNGSAEPGALQGDKIIGLKSAGFPTLLHLIQGGKEALQRVKGWLENPPADASGSPGESAASGSFVASPENYLRGPELP